MKNFIKGIIDWVWNKKLGDPENIIFRDELIKKFGHGTAQIEDLKDQRNLKFFFYNHSSKPDLKPYALEKSHYENIPTSQVCRIDKARIYGKIGIASKDGRILVEPSLNKTYYVRQTGDRKYILFNKFFRTKRLSGKYLMLSTAVSNNYFMWITYFIPLLKHFMELDQKPIVLLNNSPSQFQIQSLQYFGFDDIYELGQESPIIEVERLMIPTFDYLDIEDHAIGHYNILNPKNIKWLNTAISTSSSNQERIYITRKNTNQRRIVNEDELTSLLASLKFKIIEPEELSFAEQLAIFKTAKCIIAPHGAALVNTIFSNRAKVIELYPSNRTLNNPKNLQICSALGHEYHLMIIEAINQKQDMHLSKSVLEDIERIIE